MPEAVMNITDTELMRLLRASFIDREQVAELQLLLPEMTAVDKQQLVALIDQSHEEAAKAESAYQERLRDINAQYDVTLNNLVKESTEKAFKDFEAMENKKEAEELKAVEGEIIAAPSAAPDATASATPIRPARNRHVIVKLIVILLFLLTVAGIYIYSVLNP